MFNERSQLHIIHVDSAIGDSAARSVLEKALTCLKAVKPSNSGSIIAFDLEKAELATTSFIKGSILALFQSGRLSTEPATISAADAFGIPAFDVYPVLTNANQEIESLTDEIFARRGFAILSLKPGSGNEGEYTGKMLGHLDEALLRTMQSWEKDEALAASDLRRLFPKEGISQTAWSNRLNDLWRMRLLQRYRKGKSWIYKPTIGGVDYGR